MRFIHTSDWHLGQSLHQFDRQFEHERFLEWLLTALEEEQADALLVAGDVFDNSNPSSASQRLLYRFLTEARRRRPGLQVVITAGNHDSPARLEAPLPLLEELGVAVLGHVPDISQPDGLRRLLLPLHGADGAVAAWCIAMPFLRPADLPPAAEGQDSYGEGVARLYQAALEQALALRQPEQAIIAMGHCHLAGGQVSEDSERPIVIGGSEALPVSLFDPAIAYVALGHLHRAQSVGQDSRRYSGSPLPLSFSELNYPHQVLVVDTEGANVAAIRAKPVPRAVELLRIPDQPAPLPEVLAQLSALSLPEQPEAQWPYLLVRVRLTEPEPGLRAAIEAALDGKPVRLARIETRYARNTDSPTTPRLSVDDLQSLAPTDFFQRLYQHRFGEAPPEALMGVFGELVTISEQ